MNSRNNIAAVILAAGYSSRMPQFKPLLPVGQTTALGRTIALFEDCGLADIRVVTGHRAGEVESAVARTAARVVFNPRHAEGMFSSVTAGVRALDPDCRAFFILPVDVALVRPSTVARLLDAWAETGRGICYPSFGGRRGHPPLIGAELIPDILQWPGEGGLQGCLLRKDHLAFDVAVADEAILLDMDTAEGYTRILERWRRYEIPTAAECRALMQEVDPVPPAVWNHCRAVARVAAKIGAALNRAGCKLDLGLIEAAGLTHDIARRQKDHAAAGARLLADLGFAPVAGIVAVHMDIEISTDEAIDERQVVHLADKLVSGDQETDLAQRFERKIKKYGHEPGAAAAIARRRDQALQIKARIEKTVGEPIETILAGAS